MPKPITRPLPYDNGTIGNFYGPTGWYQLPFGNPQAGDVWQGYNDLFQQFSSYDKNFLENLFNLNNTDARDFAFNQLGKQQDYLLSLEQRQYNEHMLNDQRRYDYELLQDDREFNSPLQQLQRLMATGLSRQAALQYMNGAQSSPIAGTSLSAPSVASSADGTGVSAASGVSTDRFLHGISTAVSTVSGIMGLVTAGINVSNASKQAELLNSNVYSQTMQANAIRDVGEFIAAIYAKDKDGHTYARPNFNDLSSADEWLSWAESDERRKDNPAVYNFMRSPKARMLALNPFATALLDQQFTSHSNAQQDKNTEEAFLRAQLLTAQKDIAQTQWKQALLDYDWNSFKFEDYNLTRPTINEYNLRKWSNDLYILTQTSDKNTLKYLVDKMKNDAEFNSLVSAFHVMSERNFQGSAFSGVREISYFLQQLGIGETSIGEGIIAATAAVGAGNEILSTLGVQDEQSKPAENVVKKDVFNPLGTFFRSIYNKLPKPKLPSFLDMINQ